MGKFDLRPEDLGPDEMKKFDLRPEDLAPQKTPPAPASTDDDDTIGARIARGFGRMEQATRGPAIALQKYVDSATGGLLGKGTELLHRATGVQVGASPADYEKLQKERPIAFNVANVGGTLNPVGLAAGESKVVGGGVDLLTGLIRRKAASGVERVAARVGKDALKGAGTAAAYGATEDAIQGKQFDPSKALRSAGLGAAIGGGLGLIAGTGGEYARVRAAANPDIATLDRAGLEPGPVPGRPVIRKDQPIMKQLPGMSEPPLGVSRVTPGTRGEAGRAAADEIVPDMMTRSKANNQRFGELQGEAYETQGSRRARFGQIINDIDRRLEDQRLPDATRAALVAIRDKFEPFIPKPPPPLPPPPEPTPEMVQIQEWIAKASRSPTSQAALKQRLEELQAEQPQPPPPPAPEPPRRFTARDLDEIRDYADSKVRTGEIKPGDVQSMQVSERMRRELARRAPAISDLNTAFAETKRGFDKRKALLGMKRNQRGEGEDVYEAVARRARERDEESATSGVRKSKTAHAAERAGDLGPPTVLPGTVTPEPPNYQALLNIPRLQLAQENLQAIPSKVFSAGGNPMRSGTSMINRFAAYIPDRLMYPLARRLGEREIGAGPAAFDELAGAVRRRREEAKKKRKRTQGAESMPEGGT